MSVPSRPIVTTWRLHVTRNNRFFFSKAIAIYRRQGGRAKLQSARDTRHDVFAHCHGLAWHKFDPLDRLDRGAFARSYTQVHASLTHFRITSAD